VWLSRKQIDRSPGRLQDRPVSQQMESDLYDYYGWDPAWNGSYFGAGLLARPRSPYGRDALHSVHRAAVLEEDGDPHLRSATEVTGYHVHGTDGMIGHVENLLIDDGSWAIHYLLVSTSIWWMGVHVLISPFAVTGLSFADRTVNLNLTRNRIRASPAWKPTDRIDAAYQKRLHGYYQWPGYGW
jgi:hypothetical protein